MIIEKIIIKSFGVITDMTLEFSESVNVIEGQNEIGKSTIAAFIRYMLYGFPDGDSESSLSERFSVTCGDVKSARSLFSSERFDFVICNPPYMTATSGKMCADDYKTVARHEILCNISDVFAASYFLLGTGASLFIVYRPDRLSSLFAAAKENNFEIKKMTFVFSKIDREPPLVLCEAKKQAKEGLVLTEPFIIYGSDGQYTEKMRRVCEEGEISFGK